MMATINLEKYGPDGNINASDVDMLNVPTRGDDGDDRLNITKLRESLVQEEKDKATKVLEAEAKAVKEAEELVREIPIVNIRCPGHHKINSRKLFALMKILKVTARCIGDEGSR